MSVELINPAGLVQPQGYTHVSVATGNKFVHLAGQVGQLEDGSLAGDDVATQAAQALTNVGIALAAAGATFADVVKVVIYVVDWTPDKTQALFGGLASVAPTLGITAIGPTTMIGVQALADPALLVEFDVTAIID